MLFWENVFGFGAKIRRNVFVSGIYVITACHSPCSYAGRRSIPRNRPRYGQGKNNCFLPEIFLPSTPPKKNLCNSHKNKEPVKIRANPLFVPVKKKSVPSKGGLNTIDEKFLRQTFALFPNHTVERKHHKVVMPRVWGETEWDCSCVTVGETMSVNLLGGRCRGENNGRLRGQTSCNPTPPAVTRVHYHFSAF